MKVAFFDAKPYDREAFDAAAEAVGMELHYYDGRLSLDTVALARGCDAVCVFVNDCIGPAVIDALVELGVRVIALRCAGYNNVDVRYAKGKISVVRVPAYSPHAVAEHAMAMVLAAVRRVHRAYHRTKDFNFSLEGLVGFDLHGKTAGIVGMGKIGRAFARICRGFGMRILAYDLYPSEMDGVEYVSLDRLFRESHVISLHCPLTADTYHLIGEESLACMQKGVVLVNTSRGALVDAEALLAAIKSRKVGAACLDVYEEEEELFFRDLSGRIVEDDTLARLITMPNVLLTAHQGFLTREALCNIAETTVSNIVAVLSGEGCPNCLTSC